MRFSQPLVLNSIIGDEVSLIMTFITIFVLFISYLFATSSTLAKRVSLSAMLIFCLVVFNSDNMFFLYLSYEASLLPILYIIVK